MFYNCCINVFNFKPYKINFNIINFDFKQGKIIFVSIENGTIFIYHYAYY